MDPHETSRPTETADADAPAVHGGYDLPSSTTSRRRRRGTTLNPAALVAAPGSHRVVIIDGRLARGVSSLGSDTPRIVLDGDQIAAAA
jgi:hypothetical protein